MNSLLDPTLNHALAVFAFAALGLWIITFHAVRSSWRYELFAVDFALGTFLFALPAVFVLGNFGTDLPFSDRLLVSSKTAQAMMLAAGFIFGVGNTLLLGAVSLLGVAGAFAIGGGAALLLSVLIRFNGGSAVLNSSAAALFLLAAIAGALACSGREGRVPEPPSIPRANYQPKARRFRRSTKGILVAILGGCTLGAFYPLALRGIFDDFGMGPYAGLFLFCVGVLIGNIVFSLYFFNIALDGAALPLRSYLKGWPGKHLAGLLGGVLWAAGALAVALTRTPAGARATAVTAPGFNNLPIASVLLPVLLGLLLWREFAQAPRAARLFLVGALLCLAAGLWIIIASNQA